MFMIWICRFEILNTLRYTTALAFPVYHYVVYESFHAVHHLRLPSHRLFYTLSCPPASKSSYPHHPQKKRTGKSVSLALVTSGGHDPSHHFLLGNQVINAFQVIQKALHITAPLVQHIISVARFGKVDEPGWAVNLGVNRLRCDQVTDVLLRLLLGQIQELGQTACVDTRVVFSNHPHIVLDDALPEILPSLICLILRGLTGLSIEYIRIAQMGTELLLNHRPAH